MVTISRIQNGIIRFVEREIAPSLSMLEKIAVGGTINLFSGKLPLVIDKFAGNKMFSLLEIYNREQGTLDMDALYDAIRPYVGVDPISIPVKVPMLGIDLNLKFTQSDIDTLFKYIKEA